MNIIIIKSLMFLGLNKVFLKISGVIGLMSTIIIEKLNFEIPRVILGVTIFLWILYVLTVCLDWYTGIKASRYEAKKEGREFKFDKNIASNSWLKHALFIIIIATIYFLQKEVIRLEMGKVLSTTLVGAQFFYFAYNMLTEWYSIELNKKRLNDGKESRSLKLINYLLESMDSGFQKKIDKMTGSD